MPTHNLTTTDELAAELGDPNLGVIDASWQSAQPRIGAAEFRQAHIPGAVFFDIDAIADLESGLPHMLPKPETLAKGMGALGLGDGMRLVVYDGLGLVRRGAGVVDAARLRRHGDPHPRGRPAEMEQARAGRWKRRRPDRDRPPVSRRGSTRVSSPRSTRCARRSRTGSAQVVDARPRPLPRRSARAAAGGQGRSHARQPQPAVRRHRRARPPEIARRAQGRLSPRMGSTWRSRSSPPAARGSPPRSWRWRSRRRRQGRGPLRRLVGRMGLARRLPGGDRAGLTRREPWFAFPSRIQI